MPSPGAPSPEAAAWQSLLDIAAERAPLDAARDRLTADSASSAFADLYLPLCLPAQKRSRVLGHLGQSIDGFVATASGDSHFVNDAENIRHLHRLRALHDAVVVGAGTIAADDPRLTTRHVEGSNPVRVVLDPRRRLEPTARVFTDGGAPTILVAAEGAGGDSMHGLAEVLFVPIAAGMLDLSCLLEQLAGRGLRRVLVEGGGTTVSRFFDAGLLDRLHIAVAPVFTGRGKAGLRVAANERMDDCPRPHHRVFTMGKDILFDCDLRSRDARGRLQSSDSTQPQDIGVERHESYPDTGASIRRIR